MTENLPRYFQEANDILAQCRGKLAEKQEFSKEDEILFTVALHIVEGYKKRLRDERNQSVHTTTSP